MTTTQRGVGTRITRDYSLSSAAEFLSGGRGWDFRKDSCGESMTPPPHPTRMMKDVCCWDHTRPLSAPPLLIRTVRGFAKNFAQEALVFSE